LFPWVEDARRAYEKRASINAAAIDLALDSFLKAVVWFRSVLLQDLAVLKGKYPSAPIFSFHPFNTSSFETYASTLAEDVAEAEAAKGQEFSDLPASISDALSAAVAQVVGKMNEHFVKLSTIQLQLREEQQDTTDAVLGLTVGKVRKRSREAGNTLEEMVKRLDDLTLMMTEMRQSVSRFDAFRVSALFVLLDANSISGALAFSLRQTHGRPTLATSCKLFASNLLFETKS
jgi:predicted nucleic acid-binding protein